MAYRNYNNNSNRYNGGYNRNNNQYYNNHRNQNDRPAFNGFDATVYKKPDIELKGLSGKIYRISGNFSGEFGAYLCRIKSRVDTVADSKLSDIEKFPELYELLKDFTLQLINLNTEGVTYSMDAVQKDFNDIYVMWNLLRYIDNHMGKKAPDLVREAQNSKENIQVTQDANS